MIIYNFYWCKPEEAKTIAIVAGSLIEAVDMYSINNPEYPIEYVEAIEVVNAKVIVAH
jgi:hypothetical protein